MNAIPRFLGIWRNTEPGDVMRVPVMAWPIAFIERQGNLFVINALSPACPTLSTNERPESADVIVSTGDHVAIIPRDQFDAHWVKCRDELAS